MPRSYVCLHYHFIFSTKRRQAWIQPNIQPRLWEYIGGILRAKKSVLIAAGGMPDHVHLLVGLDKELAVSDALRDIKANSSSWIHKTFPELAEFDWQDGYSAFTVSYSGMDAVEKYIARQEVHHQAKTYQEELIEILKLHRVEYDERFMWD